MLKTFCFVYNKITYAYGIQHCINVDGTKVLGRQSKKKNRAVVALKKIQFC